MITRSNLPRSYRPYKSLDFCSNVIVGGGHILVVGEILPLLVGEGKSPRIWLQAISRPGSKEFITVVDDSRAVHPVVSVEVKDKSIVIYVGSRIVLRVESTKEGEANVSEVDFRPLGLNVFGNSSALTIGGMSLSNNTFSNVGVAFAIDD